MSADTTGSSDIQAPVVLETFGDVQFLLFDSLVHHLIEKGVLTKNDALSVVQVAAQVVRGQIHESGNSSGAASAALATLERTFASFEAVPDRNGNARPDMNNVHPLRAPLHGDRPQFPDEDD